jgi:ABC-type polysaccharide/polyol phosphate transport system ATPase subunit
MKEKMKSGQTTVFVSHGLADVQELCKRVVWIDHGLVKMIGSPEEVIPVYREHVY